MRVTTYTIDEAKLKANNTPMFIRPINSDESHCPYAFSVVNGVMIDDRNRKENESNWIGHQFIIQTQEEAEYEAATDKYLLGL